MCFECVAIANDVKPDVAETDFVASFMAQMDHKLAESAANLHPVSLGKSVVFINDLLDFLLGIRVYSFVDGDGTHADDAGFGIAIEVERFGTVRKNIDLELVFWEYERFCLVFRIGDGGFTVF